MVRAVLDANVYISAAIRADGPPGQIVERFLRDAAFEIVVSQAIVDEVLRAFAYPKVRKHVRKSLDPEAWFEDIAVLALFVNTEHSATRLSRDPDDDNYIAAAVEGRAGFVVAGDGDLLSLEEYEGIRIVRPRDFLDLLSARGK